MAGRAKRGARSAAGGRSERGGDAPRRGTGSRRESRREEAPENIRQNAEQERIRKWLGQVHFRPVLFGGVEESDVWKKISELNALYETALVAERARYDALLAERGLSRGASAPDDGRYGRDGYDADAGFGGRMDYGGADPFEGGEDRTQGYDADRPEEYDEYAAETQDDEFWDGYDDGE